MIEIIAVIILPVHRPPLHWHLCPTLWWWGRKQMSANSITLRLMLKKKNEAHNIDLWKPKTSGKRQRLSVTDVTLGLNRLTSSSPLLSEHRESQCLPKTTSILSPCLQTNSERLDCRGWPPPPLILRTCWDDINACWDLMGKEIQLQQKVRIKKYLHWMTNKTEWGRVSRAAAVWASAVQQSIKHPSVLTGLITGPTAEEGMGAVVDKHMSDTSAFDHSAQLSSLDPNTLSRSGVSLWDQRTKKVWFGLIWRKGGKKTSFITSVWKEFFYLWL